MFLEKELHPNLESMKEGLDLDKRHVSMALCKEPGPFAMAITVHKNCDDVTKDPVGKTWIAVFDVKTCVVLKSWCKELVDLRHRDWGCSKAVQIFIWRWYMWMPIAKLQWRPTQQ